MLAAKNAQETAHLLLVGKTARGYQWLFFEQPSGQVATIDSRYEIAQFWKHQAGPGPRKRKTDLSSCCLLFFQCARYINIACTAIIVVAARSTILYAKNVASLREGRRPPLKTRSKDLFFQVLGMCRCAGRFINMMVTESYFMCTRYKLLLCL